MKTGAISWASCTHTALSRVQDPLKSPLLRAYSSQRRTPGTSINTHFQNFYISPSSSSLPTK